MSNVTRLPDFGPNANHDARCSDTLSDDVLEFAIRMFLPNVSGVDFSRLCQEAIARWRDHEGCAKQRGLSVAQAKWRSTCPLFLANHVMMFGRPALAANPEYHGWHALVRKLMAERERRFFDHGAEFDQ